VALEALSLLVLDHAKSVKALVSGASGFWY
jgi:hypothetical protein